MMNYYLEDNVGMNEAYVYIVSPCQDSKTFTSRSTQEEDEVMSVL